MSTDVQDLLLFLGVDGKVDEGRLSRHYRKNVRGWKNAQILVDLYNELLSENISVRWVQRMEQQNRVPVDKVRRLVLATLLNIPPTYLGLTALKPLTQFQENIQIMLPTKATPVDIVEYKGKLRDFWKSNHRNSKELGCIPEIVTCIYNLQKALLYGKSEQREAMALLLCQYLILSGNVHRYQGYLTTAITYFDDALALANERGYNKLYAKASYLRGFTYFNEWVSSGQEREAQQKLVAAISDFHAAQQYISLLSQPLQAALLADSGRALAYQSQDTRDRLEAMSRIDQAEKLVNATGFENEAHFLRIDTDWVLLDKAEAYLKSGWPSSAIEELSNVYKGDASLHQRYLYSYILEAEASIAKGWIEIGVAYLENALMVLNKVTARRHLNRIVSLYERLKEDNRYKNSPDVARLAVRILQVQYSELFS